MKRSIAVFALILALSVFLVGCSASSGTGDAAAAAVVATAEPATTAEPVATADASAASDTKTTVGSAENGTLELTLAELAKYNGKDGQPAYVAVDGVIYDVSGYAKWKNGEHNGNSAGQDLTEVIKTKSPHGVAKLNGVPVVGKLIDG